MQKAKDIEHGAGKRAGKHERVALACQGGDSLGAYHIGVYKAMDEAGYIPSMISGISIGAFTAAILAGNEPEKRVSKLMEFWDYISWPELGFFQDTIPILPDFADEIKRYHNTLSSLQGFVYGQPHFFLPRVPAPQMQFKGTVGATSYYDTAVLRDTLLKFVDFDLINAKKTRLLLGAVKVKTGELVFFDNADTNTKIEPEHVMASGSMPPGFPGTRIDDDLYWDGGCVSNTPLDAILNAEPKERTLTFMVDLFNPVGEEPKSMDDVTSRSKDILYASRTASHIDHVSRIHNLSKSLSHVIGLLPGEVKGGKLADEVKSLATGLDFDIVHLVYKAPPYEVPTKDCEFSKSSIKDRMDHGYHDMKKALEHSPWLEPRHPYVGSKVYKYVNGMHKEV
ncbi:MAG: patatin-like phospholipase family protein [Nitrospirae bacterium]|nr:patatin-like phospholipase family protein [Nitrospirota bacterium]